MGRLEADVESIKLQWVSYRDELRRLVNRLEKRAERDEKKAREKGIDQSEDQSPGSDVITQRVLKRRNKRVHA